MNINKLAFVLGIYKIIFVQKQNAFTDVSFRHSIGPKNQLLSLTELC